MEVRPCEPVHGSLDKHDNPNGAERCELWLGGKEPWVGNCTAVERPVPNAPAPVLDWMGRQKLNYPTETDPACRAACFTGRDLGSSCLFGHMSPAKIFFMITAARAAGVTHIVEEGREGGLTAYLYAMHGFRVTSVEYLPLDTVSRALLQQALDGLTLALGADHATVAVVERTLAQCGTARGRGGGSLA